MGEQKECELGEAINKLKWAYGGYGGLLLWSIVVILGFGVGFWEMLKHGGSYALGFMIGLGVGLAIALVASVIVYMASRKR